MANDCLAISWREQVTFDGMSHVCFLLDQHA